MNKKLKFPPPLLGAIQEGQLGLVQWLQESGVEVTGSRPGLPLWNVEEAKDCSRAARLGHKAITDVLLASVKFDFQKIHEIFSGGSGHKPACSGASADGTRRATKWTPGLSHWLSLHLVSLHSP